MDFAKRFTVHNESDCTFSAVFVFFDVSLVVAIETERIGFEFRQKILILFVEISTQST